MRPVPGSTYRTFICARAGLGQDVSISAMCRDIERRQSYVGAIDFVLATGDLAFAGKAHDTNWPPRFSTR